MATYYISPDGDDGDAGTLEEPWLTLGKAVTTAAEGDTCIFLPGVYREVGGVTVTNAGTSGNPIVFMGDPDGALTGADPGPVILTGCDTDWLPVCAANFIYCANEYVEFEQFIVASGTTAEVNTSRTGIAFHSTNNAGTVVRDCLTFATYAGVRYASQVIDGGHSGGYAGVMNVPDVRRCFAGGGYSGAYDCNVAQSILFGGYSTAYRCRVDYCTGYGSWYGFYLCAEWRSVSLYCHRGGGINVDGSLFMCCSQSPYSAAVANVANVYTYGKGPGNTGDTVGDAAHVGWSGLLRPAQFMRSLTFDVWFADVEGGDSYWVQNNTGGYGGRYIAGPLNDTRRSYRRAPSMASPSAHYMYWSAANARWELATSLGGSAVYHNTADQATPPASGWLLTSTGDPDTTTTALYTDWPTTDMLDRPMTVGDGYTQPGAMAVADYALDYDEFKTRAPSVRINGRGWVELESVVGGGHRITAGIWVKWTGSVTDKPQLRMVSSNGAFASQTATATGDGTDWEYLEVSADADRPTHVSILRFAQDTGATATWFTDPLTLREAVA